MRKKIIKLSVFLTLFGIMTSCTIEQQLSKKFGNQADSVSYLILKPSAVQKNSLHVQRIYPQFAQLSPNLQDTVWKHQTKFLDVIPDSSILNTYYDGLISKLKKTGFNIYTEEQMNDFTQKKGPKVVFRIGQFQLEEDKKKVDFSEEIRNQQELYKDIEIEVLSVNAWIEWFKSDTDSIPTKVYYATKSVSDVVEGKFFSTDDGANYEFRYKRTDLTANDVLTLSKLAAYQNAQQIVDLLFTQFVHLYYPESEKDFGFDIDRKSSYTPDETLKLIEIK